MVTGLSLVTMILFSQENVLDREVRLQVTYSKVQKILNEISRMTGYVFTYDTRIIDPDREVSIPHGSSRIITLLDSVTGDPSIKYSVIGKHIILYREVTGGVPEITPPADSLLPLSLSGKITDRETGEALQYATIGIRHRGKGTVTNSNGEFILKVTSQCINDTLSVSYVGYLSRSVTVRSLLGNDMTITMDRVFVSIPEIIVRFQDPLNIISKALAAIPDNYGTTPALLTGFYREGVYRKKEPQIYTEAVLQVFKSAYSKSLFGDQIKVLRSRKIENLDVKDTLAVRLKAGLSSTLSLDGVSELFDFMDPASAASYNYHMTDIVTFDDCNAYVISFEQKEWIEDPLMKGDIYINTDDYAIMLVEFEVNPLYVSKTSEAFISRLPNRFSMKPEYVRYRTQYRNIDGRYYLSHVRGDLGFLARGRKALFNSHFNVFFELAVTNHRTEDVHRFERVETAPVYSVFSNTVRGYDSEFWKGFDFLKPEDDLVSALEKVNQRLGLFGE